MSFLRVVFGKLSHYRSFYKFTGLHGVAILALAYIASSFSSVDVNGQAMPFAVWFEYPAAFGTVAVLARWLFYIPAFFTVQLVASELELKIVRAQIIAGWEHRDVVIGWLLQSLLLVLIGLSFAVITVAVLGRANANGTIDVTAALKVALGFVIYGMGFLSFAVLAAAVLRRPVPALVFLCLWPLMIEPLVGYGLERAELIGWRDFMPFATFGTLVPWPGSEAFDPASTKTFVALGYAVLANVLTWAKLSSGDQ